MPKYVLEGDDGLLSGIVVDTEAPARPLRPLEPEAEKRVLDLIERGKEQETALAAEERQLAVGDELEAAIRPYLKNELAAELDGGGSPEQRRKDIGLLKTCCAKWGLPLNLPHEPVPWAAVAALLIEQDSIEAATRLRNSISFAHRSLNLSDPTSDHMINAVLRSIANRKDPAPAL
jgi:hypothetical protein